MSVLTYDSDVVYDAANYTFDGYRIGGGAMDLSALLFKPKRVYLTDPDWPDEQCAERELGRLAGRGGMWG